MTSRKSVLVAGGTGVVGRAVVAELSRRGHTVTVLSRSGAGGARADVSTGDGLDAAMTGIGTVVDTTNITTFSGTRAARFFTAATTNLLAAARRAGTGHHVLLSIVGIDRVPNPYYAAKLRQEAVVEAGDVPWTIVRATQFHEFAAQMITRTSAGPFVLAPRLPVQPVATAEVAAALADAVERGPSGRAPDVGGPQREDLADLMRRELRFQGSRRLLVPFRMPGGYGRAAREGGQLLHGDDVRRGGPSFAEWLAGRTK
ncbi:SDR family oxidoreductase [Catenuloplanes japonicus]|uniref:SDR family oxidoreductase n=1 Tax=Catenuloplanes japonicus TaxID=33876 RepID=UPI000527C108|nr:NAD(P)H-binding protein [Catenuloplanes japonicus]